MDTTTRRTIIRRQYIRHTPSHIPLLITAVQVAIQSMDASVMDIIIIEDWVARLKKEDLERRSINLTDTTQTPHTPTTSIRHTIRLRYTTTTRRATTPTIITTKIIIIMITGDVCQARQKGEDWVIKSIVITTAMITIHIHPTTHILHIHIRRTTMRSTLHILITTATATGHTATAMVIITGTMDIIKWVVGILTLFCIWTFFLFHHFCSDPPEMVRLVQNNEEETFFASLICFLNRFRPHLFHASS